MARMTGWGSRRLGVRVSDRPDDLAWKVIRRKDGNEAEILLPRQGAGMYVRCLADGTTRVAHWERPEDADQAMREAGIE
jgi:hypothetical protein